MKARESVEGRRVRVLSCSDTLAPLEAGLEGTVRHVDDMGTLHVAWDNGRTLGLIPDEDTWEVLPS